nr:hypothetical protein [Tanacetum cinerariifolium]
MDLLSFIRTADPTKVRVGKRERDEASVDKLFDEGGSGEQADQGDSAGGGHGIDVQTSVPIMTNATNATPTVDPAAIAKEKVVSASVFGGDSSFAGKSQPISGYFSDRTGGDFLVGGIRTVVDPDSNLQRVYVPHWNVTNGFCMDDDGVCREMVDEFASPLNFFASIRGMEHDHLFTEFNVGAARQISLGAEVRMRAEYNIKEKRRLKPVVEEKDSLLKSRCDEIESLKAQLLIKEAEATEVVCLRDEAQALKERNTYLEKKKMHKLEVASSGLQEKLSHYENLMERYGSSSGGKVLPSSAYYYLWPPMAPYPWHETCYYQVLHSSEYLSTLGVAIEKAIENGIQDGLAAEITHGVEGRVLADVAAYNPSEDADYFSALQRLQNINFSLLVKLRSNKDASVDTIMNILLLEDNRAERLGLTESQPCVDQLMVPIHHSLNRVVVGATSLSFSLDVSDARVRKIRENIASQRPGLRDVFTPISEPFSAEVLTGTGGTYDTVPAPITTSLSVTSISVSIIPPISTDDYETAHTKGGEDAVTDVEALADEGADPFPDVSGAELDASE